MDFRTIVALVSLAAGAAAATDQADQIIARIQNRYNNARTLTVDFSETYSTGGRTRPPETGHLSLRKQGKMRWDYTNPAGKLFISDGKSVFLYTALDNRVEKIPLKDTEDMRAPLAFLLGHLDMKKEFRDFQVRDGSGGTWLEASGRSDRAPYSRIRMLVAPNGSIRQMNITGRDESELAFTFSNEQINPALPEKLFHFDIPAGAEVVNSIEVGEQ